MLQTTCSRRPTECAVHVRIHASPPLSSHPFFSLFTATSTSPPSARSRTTSTSDETHLPAHKTDNKSSCRQEYACQRRRSEQKLRRRGALRAAD
eukprot:435143-Pleurochrysis_carterae.AAC.2